MMKSNMKIQLNNSIIRFNTNSNFDLLQQQNSPAPIRKFTHKPLGLNPQQLIQRINSLKDFNMYQRTKLKRIAINQIAQSQSSPIISTALSYGLKNQQNQVLHQYLKQKNFSQIQTTHKKLKEIFSKNINKQKGLPKRKMPSFINFKKEEKEQKPKIYKMINSQEQNYQRYQQILKNSYPKNHPSLNQNKKVIPFPKQLTRLKNRLLSVSIDRVKTTSTHINQLQQINSLNIESNQKMDEHSYDQGQELKQNQNNVRYTIEFHQNKSKEDYKSDVQQILDISIDQIKVNKYMNNITSHRSNKLINFETKRNAKKHKNKPQGRSQIQYWPNYHSIRRSNADQIKINEIGDNLTRECQNNIDIPQPVHDLQRAIVSQINMQQRQLDSDLIEGDRNSLGNRFNLLLQMEHQIYKRDLKGLFKSRQQFKIQRQREEIWANGVKRLRRLGFQKFSKGTSLKKVYSDRK